MNNSSSSSSMIRYGTNSNPFTANQWQELEHQALIYKYLISGIPVPPDLLLPLNRSSSLHLMGWSGYNVPSHLDLSHGRQYYNSNNNSNMMMMVGRKIDPEPGRCRRTDGKKWRCSKEAYPDSKYCDRHMHRGKNRSRKHVEPPPPAAASAPLAAARSSLVYSSSPSLDASIGPALLPRPEPAHHQYGYFLDSQLHSDYRYSGVLKEGVDEYAFFSPEPATGTTPAATTTNLSVDDTWHLSPLKISSSSSNSNSGSSSSYLQLQSNPSSHHYSLYGHHLGLDRLDEQEPPAHKTIHRFFDDQPIRGGGGRDSSWLDPSEDNKSSSSSSSTRLSISMPSSSSIDFPLLFGSRRDNNDS